MEQDADGSRTHVAGETHVAGSTLGRSEAGERGGGGGQAVRAPGGEASCRPGRLLFRLQTMELSMAPLRWGLACLLSRACCHCAGCSPWSPASLPALGSCRLQLLFLVIQFSAST